MTINKSTFTQKSLSLPREIINLFIMLNLGMWATMIYMTLINYLQKTYTGVAVSGLGFILSLSIFSTAIGMLSKPYSKVDTTKIYNMAMLMAFVHIFLDIIRFPTLNWLYKDKTNG